MSKFSLCFLALFLLFASFSAQAQMPDRLTEYPNFGKTLTRDAGAMTREMVNRLHLNEGQILKIMPLNRTKLASLNSINREFKNDEAGRAAKAAELEAQYEQECSRILTPSQLSQLQQSNGQPTTAPASAGHGLG